LSNYITMYNAHLLVIPEPRPDLDEYMARFSQPDFSPLKKEKKKRKKLVPVREAPEVPSPVAPPRLRRGMKKKKEEKAKQAAAKKKAPTRAVPKKKRGGIATTRFNKDGTKSVQTKTGKKFRVKQKKD